MLVSVLSRTYFMADMSHALIRLITLGSLKISNKKEGYWAECGPCSTQTQANSFSPFHGLLCWRSWQHSPAIYMQYVEMMEVIQKEGLGFGLFGGFLQVNYRKVFLLAVGQYLLHVKHFTLVQEGVFTVLKYLKYYQKKVLGFNTPNKSLHDTQQKQLFNRIRGLQR